MPVKEYIWGSAARFARRAKPLLGPEAEIASAEWRVLARLAGSRRPRRVPFKRTHMKTLTARADLDHRPPAIVLAVTAMFCRGRGSDYFLQK